MTEQQWWNSIYPLDLLRYLGRKTRPVSSPRKIRLFACACVRHIGRLLRDRRLVDAIGVAERYSDGSADSKQMRAAGRAAFYACAAVGPAWSDHCGAAAAQALTAVPRSADRERRMSMRVARVAAYDATQAVRYAEQDASEPGKVVDQEREYQCALLRDIFGNPFRLQPAVNPAWL